MNDLVGVNDLLSRFVGYRRGGGEGEGHFVTNTQHRWSGDEQLCVVITSHTVCLSVYRINTQ